MKDFLGNEYAVGDKVLYAAMSGRSVTMVLAEVVSIRKVYRDPDKYAWTDIGLDEEVPYRRRWNRELQDYEPTEERVDTEFRVSVQPLDSSRWTQHYGKNYYTDTRTGKPIKNPYEGEHFVGHDGSPNAPFAEHVKKTNVVKPVTLTVTDNIVLWRRKDAESHPEWKACK